MYAIFFYSAHAFKFEEYSIKGQITVIKITGKFHICTIVARKEELSNDIKLLVVTLLKSGISEIKFAQTFGCAQSTVCENWKTNRSRNDVRKLPLISRARVTSSRQDQESG